MLAIFLALVLLPNAASLLSEQDACVLHQSSALVKPGLQLALAGHRKDHSMLQKSVSLGRESHDSSASAGETGSLVGGMLDAQSALKGARSDSVPVSITRDENESVVVNISKHSSNKKANHVKVDPNTTDITVERKIVNNHGSKREVHSGTHTHRSTKGHSHATKNGANYTNASDSEKPFAKENVTVHRHQLNITRRVNAKHNKTQNVTITDVTKVVDVASPFHIASIYIVLFGPVSIAWAMYFKHGQQAHYYVWLLPLTMCTMSIGQDLVNQSLTVILEAPNLISAIQAFSMAVATCIWSLSQDWSSLRMLRWKLTGWIGVAIFFAMYQIMNHLVYAMCSLSERTVITNLAPVLSLIIERTIMPEALKPNINFGSKMALCLMVTGAFLFSIQTPSFTRQGIGVALLLLLATVPYRLAQRRFLAEVPELPLAALACIDGFVLFVPSTAISVARNLHFWNMYSTAAEAPVLFMLVLSVMTFAGLHICSLAMLRLGAATTYLVHSNIASLGTIALGIFFFGDRALGTSLACVGLAANVGSGIWYSVEATTIQIHEQNCKDTQSDSVFEGGRSKSW